MQKKQEPCVGSCGINEDAVKMLLGIEEVAIYPIKILALLDYGLP